MCKQKTTSKHYTKVVASFYISEWEKYEISINKPYSTASVILSEIRIVEAFWTRTAEKLFESCLNDLEKFVLYLLHAFSWIGFYYFIGEFFCVCFIKESFTFVVIVDDVARIQFAVARIARHLCAKSCV